MAEYDDYNIERGQLARGEITPEYYDYITRSRGSNYMNQGGFTDPETGEPVLQDEQGNFVDKNGQIITEPDRIRDLTQQALMLGKEGRGQPTAPTYESFLTKKGTLPSQYLMEPGMSERLAMGVGPGYERFTEEALSREYTPWVEKQKEALALQTQAGREQMGRDISSEQAGALSNLAMAGGLRGGQREALGRQSIWAQQAGSQDLARQKMMGGIDIESQDILRRQQMLSQLPGLEMQKRYGDISAWTQAQDIDTARALSERARQDQLKQKQYEQQMAAYGANRQAQLQAAESFG